MFLRLFQHYFQPLLLLLYLQPSAQSGEVYTESQKSTTTGPSVNYVISSIFGNFFVKNNLSLKDEDVFTKVLAKSLCECRTACWATNVCQAAALVPVEDHKECHLAKEGPHKTTTQYLQGAIYLFKEDSLPGHYHGLMKDNLTYYEPPEMMELEEGKKWCNRIPGHRLVIIKTNDQLKTLQEISLKTLGDTPTPKLIWMNLKKPLQSNEKIWGDGTLVKITEVWPSLVFGDALQTNVDDVEEFFKFDENTFKSSSPSTQMRILCQANPVGVYW
ncbi:uncharacterized protein LOC121859621 [Homarus americanus]|uniref:Apple domain-containing protein n=1 Tax=Homarus americanus TaxID=6706 RepID=A0A8J5N692_HOMAM|nr:uncharacterized protein LOC121859621 [Homarus americanus]KAG7174305.1 hypothetical protein Hamer_G003241 [Homarus americanus]